MSTQSSKVQRQVLGYILKVAAHIVSTARVSIKLRTLVKYGYIAYTYRTLDFNKLRGLTSKVSVPKHLTSAPFYKAVEGELKRKFDVRFEYRRNYKYAVFSAKPLIAPPAQHLEPGVIRRKRG